MRIDRLFEKCVTANYIHVENGGDYALQRFGSDLYIYLERSDGGEDWKNNLNFPKRAYRRMGKTVWHAHRGFLTVWKSIENYIADAVFDQSVRRVTVVGYSHGGALAVICHEYIYYNRPDLRENLFGYGFGAPRVIWKPSPEIAERWENFTVVRNPDDAVTHLPPELFGYRHVGKMLNISKKGSYSPIDAHREENISKELQRIYGVKKEAEN